jgi:hypothetical protein
MNRSYVVGIKLLSIKMMNTSHLVSIHQIKLQTIETMKR